MRAFVPDPLPPRPPFQPDEDLAHQMERANVALGDLGITREVTGRTRGRVFAYDACLEALQSEDA